MKFLLNVLYLLKEPSQGTMRQAENEEGENMLEVGEAEREVLNNHFGK